MGCSKSKEARVGERQADGKRGRGGRRAGTTEGGGAVPGVLQTAVADPPWLGPRTMAPSAWLPLAVVAGPTGAKLENPETGEAGPARGPGDAPRRLKVTAPFPPEDTEEAAGRGPPGLAAFKGVGGRCRAAQTCEDGSEPTLQRITGLFFCPRAVEGAPLLQAQSFQRKSRGEGNPPLTTPGELPSPLENPGPWAEGDKLKGAKAKGTFRPV